MMTGLGGGFGFAGSGIDARKGIGGEYNNEELEQQLHDALALL